MTTKLLIEYHVGTYFIWVALPKIRTGLKQPEFTMAYLLLKPEQPLTFRITGQKCRAKRRIFGQVDTLVMAFNVVHI